MKRLFSLIMALGLLCNQQLLSSPTLIQGNAFFYRGKTLELHQYLDLFTFKSEAVETYELSNDGNFKFNVEIEKSGLFLLKVGKVHTHVFLEPGDQYTIVIPEPEDIDQFNPAKDVFVQSEIFEAQSKLNYHITKLEQRINNHIIENTGIWITKGAKESADQLLVNLDREFGSIDSPFFVTYFHFRKAEIKVSAGHSRKNVYAEYFQNKPIGYDQLSYRNAFSLLYNDMLHPKSTKKLSDSIEVLITKQRFSKLNTLLATEPMLENKELRSLLIINELYELGRERLYPLNIILALLDSASMVAPLQQKIIVSDAKSLLTKMAPGTKVPDLTFTDVMGNLSRLSEFEGRHIYVQFFDKFTPETIKQMSLMKVLKEGYGADIAMFSISTEESLRNIQSNVLKYDFDWYFGKSTYPDHCVTDFDLRAMPSYFFIDEQLNLISSPAPPPGERIERQFARIWEIKHPNKDMHFKLQPPPAEEMPVGN